MPKLKADSKTILLVGGSVRAAAVDAHHAGFSIVAIDHFGDADLRAVCHQWIHLQRTDDWATAITDRKATIVPTGGFDWPATGPPSHQGLVTFPSQSQFDAMRDPKVLADLAGAANITFPITLNPDELASFDWSKQQHWMIKPHAGTGGLGIRTLADSRLSLRESSGQATLSLRESSGQATLSLRESSGQATLSLRESSGQATLSRSQRRLSAAQWQLRPNEYLQQRIVGRPIGVNFISRFRDGTHQTKLLAAFAGLTHRQNPLHRWLYGGSIGPLELHHAISGDSHQQLRILGDRIAERFELVGLFNVDFVLKPDRSLVLLEINPRYSASMELMPTAGHLIDCHIAAYEEREGLITSQEADRRHRFTERQGGALACKRIVYAMRSTRFDSAIEDLRHLVRDLSEPHAIGITFHDIPSTDDVIPSGCPILTIIARQQDAATPSTAKLLIRQTHRISARIRKTLG